MSVASRRIRGDLGLGSSVPEAAKLNAKKKGFFLPSPYFSSFGDDDEILKLNKGSKARGKGGRKEIEERQKGTKKSKCGREASGGSFRFLFFSPRDDGFGCETDRNPTAGTK